MKIIRMKYVGDCLAALFLVCGTIPVICGVGLTIPKVKKNVMESSLARLVISMAHILEAGLLNDVCDEVELVTRNMPDQLRTIITRGDVDVVSLPGNVAALFLSPLVDPF